MASTSVSWGDAIWGIASAESGFILENVSHSFSNKNKTVMDRNGCTSSYTAYDETAKVSLKGKLPTTTPFAGTLASELTLGNALGDYFEGGTGGLTIIESITIDMSNEDYKSISLEATHFPNLT